MSEKISPKKRHKARSFLVQALYQWQLTGNDVNEILLNFLTEMNPKKTDSVYFKELLQKIVAQVSDIDSQFVPYLDRPVDEIGPIELAILRIATYELCERIEMPYKVVLNEAIELAKVFGPEDAHKYINSIIDKVADAKRSIERNLNQ